MKNSKEIQKKYIELQLLNQSVNEIEQSLVNTEKQIEELKMILESLYDAKTIKPKSELFVPLGGGIFTKAELKKNEGVLMNVGSGIIVKKSFLEAERIVEDQMRELEKIFSQNQLEMSRVVVQIREIQKEIQSKKEE